MRLISKLSASVFERYFLHSNQEEDERVLATSPPLFRITLTNAERTPLNIRMFKDFDPRIKAGETLDLRTLGLGSIEAGLAYYNLAASLQADDPATPLNEGIKNIARYLKYEYFPQHPEILQAAQVSDISHLTPRQAIKLADLIVKERLRYSANPESVDQTLNDEIAIEELLRRGPHRDGNGVCRNYSAIAKGILEALKQMQDPRRSELNTTYALDLPFDRSFTGAIGTGMVPGAVPNHSWNSYLTVTSTGIETTVIDSTWGDSRGDHGDYTERRFLTLVNDLGDRGLIDPELLLHELLAIYESSPPDDPLLYLIASQILSLLTASRLTASRTGDTTWHPTFLPVMSFYSRFLKDHAQFIKDTKPFMEKPLDDLLFPFMRNLRWFCSFLPNLPQEIEGQELYSVTCDQLWDWVLYEFDRKDLEKALKWLRETAPIMLPLPGRQAIYREDPSTDPNPALREAVASFFYDWMTFSKNFPCEVEIAPQLSIAQGTPALPKIRDYFAKVDLFLVRYKKIIIDTQDDVHSYLEPHINVQHFIDGDFETIDALLKSHHLVYDK